MKLKKFNMWASSIAFLLGTSYLFSDSVGITANVVGVSGNSSGFTALIGMAMIIGSIGLFIVSMSSTDNHGIDLERLLRRTRNHEEIYQVLQSEPNVEMHKTHEHNHKKEEMTE